MIKIGKIPTTAMAIRTVAFGILFAAEVDIAAAVALLERYSMFFIIFMSSCCILYNLLSVT